MTEQQLDRIAERAAGKIERVFSMGLATRENLRIVCKRAARVAVAKALKIERDSLRKYSAPK